MGLASKRTPGPFIPDVPVTLLNVQGLLAHGRMYSWLDTVVLYASECRVDSSDQLQRKFYLMVLREEMQAGNGITRITLRFDSNLSVPPLTVGRPRPSKKTARTTNLSLRQVYSLTSSGRNAYTYIYIYMTPAGSMDSTPSINGSYREQDNRMADAYDRAIRRKSLPTVRIMKLRA